MKPRVSRLQFLSAFLGNLFEHYDTALFALLAPFFAPIFFPNKEPIPALVLTYGIIPLGILAKPAGSLFFGYLSNKFGRKFALIFSLISMGIVSCGMAFLPTYAQAGALAPLLLVFGRILQNSFAAGEIIGGAVYLLEHTPEERHDFISSIYSSSTIAGILIASAGVSALYSLELIDKYWRLLYLLGASTVIFGCILSGSLKVEKSNSVEGVPKYSLKSLLKSFWKWRKEVILVGITSGFSYACYSIALVFINGLIPLISEVSLAEMMHLNTFLLIFDFAVLPVFGLLAQRYSRHKMMAAAAGMAVLSGIPLFILLEGAAFSTIIVVRMCLVTIGVWFCATFHSWSQSLLPLSQRYAIISFSYALGSQLLGSPTASISLWLYHQTGLVWSACWYWMILGLLASILLVRSQASEKQKKLACLID